MAIIRPKLTKPNPTKIKNAITNQPKIKSFDLERVGEIGRILDAKDLRDFQIPKYGSIDYFIAYKMGFIDEAQFKRDQSKAHERSVRAISTSHRPNLDNEIINPIKFHKNDDYTPNLPMNMVRDPNLTPSALKVATALLAMAYKDFRQSRAVKVTVSYIMNYLNLSRSSVQRALRALETLGYVDCSVINSKTTKMSLCLEINIGAKLLPKIYKQRSWPKKQSTNPRNSGASCVRRKESFINNIEHFKGEIIPRIYWTLKSMEGVGRSYLNMSLNDSLKT